MILSGLTMLESIISAPRSLLEFAFNEHSKSATTTLRSECMLMGIRRFRARRDCPPRLPARAAFCLYRPETSRRHFVTTAASAAALAALPTQNV